MNSIQKGHFLNILSVFMVAIGPLFSKFGLLHMSPAQAALINVVTILMACYVTGLLRGNKVTFYFEKEMIILALCNSFGVIFMFLSINLLSPVEIGFIGRFYTVFAVLLSVILLKEKLSKRELPFIILAIIGAFLFMNKGDGLTSNLLGSLFAILYTFFFALTNVFIKKTMSQQKDSNSILFTNNCVTLLFVCGYAILTDGMFHQFHTFDGVVYIMVSSLFSGFLGTILLYEALKYLRFSIANVTRAFSPILVAVISYPFFPVAITIQNTIGALVLIGSILFLTIGKRKE